jgi:hypothetical protein
MTGGLVDLALPRALVVDDVGAQARQLRRDQ